MRSPTVTVLLAMALMVPAGSQEIGAAGPPITPALPNPKAMIPDIARSKGAWAPPDIDAHVPLASQTPPCPLPEVLAGAGKRMQELVQNLQRFEAKELITYMEVDKKRSRQTAVSYVAEIQELRPGLLMVQEYRNGSSAVESLPTKLGTTGGAAFALIFHPFYVHDFEMSCEGMSKTKGQAAWQVRFAQHKNAHRDFHGYRLGQMWFPVKLKGRAWIATDSYQVLQLETDLIEPVKAIELLREHVEVEYRPVDFPRHQVQLWLPENVTIYGDFRHQRHVHRHSFADFKLFWVDTQQKTNLPEPPGGGAMAEK
jgi:hypothetical protein